MKEEEIMIELPVDESRRSASSVEFYRRDWAGKNIKIAQNIWENGPAPFGSSLWPRYYSEVKRHGSAWFRFQNAADMTLELLLEGELEYTQGGITETVRPGELYLIHEGSDTIFTAGPESYFHRLRIMLYGSMVRNFDREFQLDGRRIIHPRDPAQLDGLFRRMGEYLKRKDPAEAPEISAFACRVLAAVAREGTWRQPLPEPLRVILGDMKDDLACRRTVRELCESHGVEVHTLMRLFRKHLDTSPREYLIKLRMEAAKHLVGSTGLSMKEIAGQLGYCNALYFSTAFHQEFRMTPSEYRKQRKMRLPE